MSFQRSQSLRHVLFRSKIEQGDASDEIRSGKREMEKKEALKGSSPKAAIFASPDEDALSFPLDIDAYHDPQIFPEKNEN